MPYRVLCSPCRLRVEPVLAEPDVAMEHQRGRRACLALLCAGTGSRTCWVRIIPSVPS
jgi:hypothetical protein